MLIVDISTHSRAKAAGLELDSDFDHKAISTHSRAKAAGHKQRGGQIAAHNFNSQPREGGWLTKRQFARVARDFNSQPREGGWKRIMKRTFSKKISTHSRAKAAGAQIDSVSSWMEFQLTAARRRLAALTKKASS